MMQAVTPRRQNKTAVKAKPRNVLVRHQSSPALWLEGRGLLESVVCRHWRGRAHTSAILVLWNALLPPDLQSADLPSLQQPLSSLTALRRYLVLHPHSLAHRKP